LGTPICRSRKANPPARKVTALGLAGLKEQTTNLAQTTGAEGLGAVNMKYGKTEEKGNYKSAKQKMRYEKGGKRKKCK
jgi:hypothetical protein